MKNRVLLIIFSVCIAFFACNKNSDSERFKLLTSPTWASDSLLANGMDASGPTGLLKNFKGDAKFNADGTGNFGIYKGTWRFAYDETQLVIETDSLPVPLTTQIAELTAASLKITTSYPNIATGVPLKIRMTFNAK